MYLVYRGMTTNESGKWSDFQFDIGDGFVYRRQLSPTRPIDSKWEPDVIGWPKSSSQAYLRAFNNEPPQDTADLPGEGPWHQDFTFEDVENIYDIGFLGNAIDVFLPRRYLMAYMGANDPLND